MTHAKSGCIALLLMATGLVLPGRAFADSDAGPSSKVAIDRERYQRTVEQLLKDLDDLEDKNEDNANKNDRKYVRERIEAMRQDLQSMRQDLGAAPAAGGEIAPAATPGVTAPVPTQTPVVVVVAPTPPPTPAGPLPVTPPEFQAIVDSISKATYSGDKIGVLKDVVKSDWFTVDQVITLMGLYTYSNDKVTAGAMLYPRVIDKGDWFRVYNALTYSSDRARLQALTTGKTP